MKADITHRIPTHTSPPRYVRNGYKIIGLIQLHNMFLSVQIYGPTIVILFLLLI